MRRGSSFCERKVSPGPPSKESRFCAVRPAEGGRTARGRMGGGDYQSRRIRSMYAAVPIQIVRSVLWVSL